MPFFLEVSTCIVWLSRFLFSYLAPPKGNGGGRPPYGNDPPECFAFFPFLSDERLLKISNWNINAGD